MTLPRLYDPAKIEAIYEPDLQAAYLAGLDDYQNAADDDSPQVLLWLVDMQGDFIYPAPRGRLSVPNALEDARRTIQWIYRNTHYISKIAASLDTHTPFQIFYPTWWKRPNGEPPPPYTIITAEQVLAGDWVPVFEPEWSVHYVKTLETVGKKQLMIWPFHCMEGTTGRSLLPALSEAIMYHSGARQAQPEFLPKGTIPYTEYYSVVEPEVKYPDHPDGKVNVAFLQAVARFDLIYVAGQARSHCVLETMNSVIRHFWKEREIIREFRFLDDCSSSIAGFEARLSEFKEYGVKMVMSTDPIQEEMRQASRLKPTRINPV
jgi:nicotinamidase/pyrazinamidase